MSEQKVIMVVDDELIMRECLADILSDDGYEVIKMTSAEEALKYSKMDRINLVISDMKMPGISGDSFFASLKEKYPEIAFILMTAYSMDMQGKDLLKEGVADFILKPFEISQIRETVRKSLAGNL